MQQLIYYYVNYIREEMILFNIKFNYCGTPKEHPNFVGLTPSALLSFIVISFYFKIIYSKG